MPLKIIICIYVLQEFYRIGKRGKIYNKFCNIKSSLKSVRGSCSPAIAAEVEQDIQKPENSVLGKLCSKQLFLYFRSIYFKFMFFETV